MTSQREAAGHHPDGSHHARRHLTGDLGKSTRWRPTTQVERVRAMLEADWVCGVDFLRAMIPRYSSRLHELKRQGLIIERRPCQDEEHAHISVMYQWRIPPEAQGMLFGDLP